MLHTRTKEGYETNAHSDWLFRHAGRALLPLLWALLLSPAPPLLQAAAALQTQTEPGARRAIVRSVESVGMTVSDMDRSLDFYSSILSFAKISDVELYG